MSKKDNVFRFAVGDPKGRRSNTWRVWVSRDGENPTRDSVYVSARSVGDRFKVSLHQREWRSAFADLRELQRIALGAPPQSRTIRVVAPIPEAVPGLRRALTIVIPWLAVGLPRHGKPESGEVHWLPSLAEGEVTIVTVLFTAPGVQVSGPGLIVGVALRDGSQVSLHRMTRAALPNETAHWTHLQAILGAHENVRGAMTSDADIKGIISGDMPDGSEWLLDLPIPERS